MVLSQHFEFDPDNTSQDSWEDCNICMCKVSEKNIHWYWRNSSGRTNHGRTETQTDGRSPNHYPPQKKLVGDNNRGGCSGGPGGDALMDVL